MNNTIRDSSKPLNSLIESNNEKTSAANGNYEGLFTQIFATANLITHKKPVTSNIETQNTITQQSVKNTTKVAASTKKIPVNPNAAFVATGEQVVVTVKKSDSDNINKIYWSTDNFKTRHYISTDNQTGNYNIGVFAAGTSIEFGIDNGSGGFYRTGVAGFNPDGAAHAIVTKSKNSSFIGFEDANGGGDQDFNDVILSVVNKPKSADPAGGGYPIFNPTKPVDGGDSVQIGGQIVDWLRHLGLQGGDLDSILALLSKPNSSLDLDDFLKKLNDLLASNNLSSVSILDLFKTHKSKNIELSSSTKIETEEVTKQNSPLDLSQLNLTIKKIKDLSGDKLEYQGVKHIISMEPDYYNSIIYDNEDFDLNSLVSSGNKLNKNLTMIDETNIPINAISNNTIQKQPTPSSEASSVEVKLLNAIYRYLG